MNLLWNQLSMEHPPNHTYRISKKVFNLGRFKSILENAIKKLESQKAFHKEAAVISRLIYRMKCKFRHERGLQSMEKLNRALLNYLSLDIVQEYKNIYNFIEADENEYTLPSKQMIEFLLLKILGSLNLMTRIQKLSEETVFHFKKRIEVGHAWSIAIMVYTAVSRIWILSKHLLEKSSQFYKKLREHLQHFKSIGKPWLPSNFEVPDSFDLPRTTEILSQEPPKSLENILFKLIQPTLDDSEDLEKEININNSLNSTLKHKVEENEEITFNENNLIMSETVTNGSQQSNKDLLNILSNSEVNVDRQKSINNVKEDENSENITSHKSRTIKSEIIHSFEDCGEVIDRNTFNNSHIQINSKCLATCIKSIKKKPKSNKNETIELLSIKTKSDLDQFLTQESIPHLDKLQWNIIRNRGKILLSKINKCENEHKRKILIKRTKNMIKKCIDTNMTSTR